MLLKIPLYKKNVKTKSKTMKKSILLSFISFVLTHGIFGQFAFGVSAGINLADAKFTNIEGIDPLTVVCPFGGIDAGYALNSKLSLVADLQYSQKGYRLEHDAPIDDTKLRYSYIDIIPQMECRLIEPVSVAIGFNIGFNIGEAQKIGDGDWIDLEKYDAVTSTDFGLAATVKGYIKDLFLFVRYNHGLKNVVNVTYVDINGQTIPDVKQKLSHIQIGAGYMFMHGSE
jgi:Outer membrane protein beta-barrel domain